MAVGSFPMRLKKLPALKLFSPTVVLILHLKIREILWRY